MGAAMASDVSYRRLASDDDVWRVRAFLRATFGADAARSGVWHVARFDYVHWHVCRNVAEVPLEDVAWCWEMDGEVAALLIADGGPGDAHLSVAPGRRSEALEASMLDLAEAVLAVSEPLADGSPRPAADGGSGPAADARSGRGADGASGPAADGVAVERRRLVVWAGADDRMRTALLEQRGYRRSDVAEWRWRRSLRTVPGVAPLPPGYRLRPLGDGLDLLERCYASGLAFHDDVRVAAENRDDPGWYRNVQRAPLYRRDLDLVAEAPDGAIAGFVTVWFDDATRSAYLEPVGVVPAHRRRGLARALVSGALAAAQRIGATQAFVGGYDDAANALYGSLLGDGVEVVEAWLRRW